MNNWFDLVSLILVVVFFVAVIGGAVYVANMVSKAVTDAKEGLKTKGLHVTDSGVAIKTGKRVDRENYLDRTQATLVNSMKYASVGNTDGTRQTPTPSNDTKADFLSPGDERPSFKMRRTSSGSGAGGLLKRKNS